MAGLAALRKHSETVNAENDKLIAKREAAAKRARKKYAGMNPFDMFLAMLGEHIDLSDFKPDEFYKDDSYERVWERKGGNWDIGLMVYVPCELEDPEDFEVITNYRFYLGALDVDDSDNEVKFGDLIENHDSAKKKMKEFAKSLKRSLLLGISSDENEKKL